MTDLVVGAVSEATRALGPGIRTCIWVAGCSIRCAGCATPQLFERAAGETRTVSSLLESILQAREQHGIEGVSFSGGEPFEQAEALAALARECRLRGFSTLSWSGYTRRQLEAEDAPAGSQALLAELDVLIDGPFMRRKVAGDALRGSGNQTLHLLTNRYAPADFEGGRFDAVVGADGRQLIVSGVIDPRPLRLALKLLGVGD